MVTYNCFHFCWMGVGLLRQILIYLDSRSFRASFNHHPSEKELFTGFLSVRSKYMTIMTSFCWLSWIFPNLTRNKPNKVENLWFLPPGNRETEAFFLVVPFLHLASWSSECLRRRWKRFRWFSLTMFIE